MFEQNDKISEA